MWHPEMDQQTIFIMISSLLQQWNNKSLNCKQAKMWFFLILLSQLHISLLRLFKFVKCCTNLDSKKHELETETLIVLSTCFGKENF